MAKSVRRTISDEPTHGLPNGAPLLFFPILGISYEN